MSQWDIFYLMVFKFRVIALISTYESSVFRISENASFNSFLKDSLDQVLKSLGISFQILTPTSGKKFFFFFLHIRSRVLNVKVLGCWWASRIGVNTLKVSKIFSWCLQLVQCYRQHQTLNCHLQKKGNGMFCSIRLNARFWRTMILLR